MHFDAEQTDGLLILSSITYTWIGFEGKFLSDYTTKNCFNVQMGTWAEKKWTYPFKSFFSPFI